MYELIRINACKFRSGQKVELKQLLNGIWNNIGSNHEKQKIGRSFYNEVVNQHRYIGIIKFSHKRSDHSAVYEIV